MNHPWLILAFVLAFAAGAIVGEWDGSRRVDLRWEAKVNRQIATDERAARARATTNFRNMEVAYRANQLDTQKLRDAAARADHAARGLRDDLVVIRQRVAGDPGAAGYAALDTCHAVLGDCSERYRGMAQTADEHAADAKLCIDGWPR